MNRVELTEKIRDLKIAKGLKWKEITDKAEGLSKEYTTAALMGQMPLPEPAAKAIGTLLGLNEFEVKLLQEVPYRGSLPTSVPTDPLIYRFYELVSVYGTTFKALIEEEFGDGIMSAIDFKMDLQRQPDPNGDRVSITMSGKFLKYKMY
ncbi:MAG: cyanase [Alphaproteobacteria bacterium]|nr:cyanase [Alphaproteobacteria bacterium]MBU0798594.1 cyanase [Alphaproteobacteria bacterium]MBU0888149.1 cyanase [Alphaproteobacteria bacterium]MBU1811594.1 cyanase [Alphaproteobacteria bacterium]MBU2088928.1 cyanase [Alphaproteobacteria bacterium]